MHHVYLFLSEGRLQTKLLLESKNVVDITRHVIMHCSALFPCTFVAEISMLNDKIVL